MEVAVKDQVLLRVSDNKLVPLESLEESIFKTDPQDGENELEFILLNKLIGSEADLKDIQLFSSADDDFNTSVNHIDLQDLFKKPASSRKYDNINISSSLIENDIQENFNFKSIMSNQASFKSLFEGLDVSQLQTFEQLFFNNFSKIKNSFRKFKGLSKDCLTELRHLETIQKCVDLLNKHYLPKRNVISGQVHPCDELKLQFQNLKDNTVEVLQLYREGIQHLKEHELHPKLQVDGKKYLIDIYYKEEQMNSFRDSLKR